MSFVQGRCNCGKVRVKLSALPDNSLMCYCDNCRRSGGPCSVNIVLGRNEVTIDDPDKVLNSYMDKNISTSGTLERMFCATCGSPVFSFNSTAPDLYFVKASLFDVIPPPSREAFSSKKPKWLKPIEGSKLV